MADTKKVILWVALGCGGVVFLGLATCVGVGYYAKKKITAEIAQENPGLAEAISKGGVTGGIQAAGGQMIAAGASMYGSMVLVTTLPKEEQGQYVAVLERLVKVGPQLTTEDIDAITQVMDQVQKAHEGDKTLPTADEAREFFAVVQPIAEKYEPK